MVSRRYLFVERFPPSLQLGGGRLWNLGKILLIATFAIVTAIALLELADVLKVSGLVFLILYSFFAVGLTIILRISCGRSYARLWCCALTVRLSTVLAFSIFPPVDYIGFSDGYSLSGILFPDEAYYILSAHTALHRGLWAWIDLGNQYERIVSYYAVIIAYTGDELIWGRLGNVLLTSLASIFIYDAIIRSTSLKIHRLAWWATALTPVFVVWSCVYLKEAILVLGVAMLINSAVALSQGDRNFRYWWFILFGTLLCIFARGEVLILLLPTLAIALCRVNARRSNRFLFNVAVGTTLVSIFLLTTFLYDLLPLVGRDPFYFLEKQNKIIESGITFPFFNMINGFPGPLRSFGFGILLLINPIITGVWNLIPIVGNPSWMVAAVSAYAITWWFCLPLWLVAGWGSIKQRDGWWMLLTCVLVIWIFISAIMRFGAGYDAFRYREAFMPLTILLAMRGLHYIHAESTKQRQWRIILKVYASMILGLIVLRGVGVLSM